MARKKISETMPEATTEEQVLQESVKQEKEEKLIQLASTQMWSPIKDLRDGIIVTKDGRYVQLLEFSPINFELRPEGDKIHIADRFGSALTLFPNKNGFVVVFFANDIKVYIVNTVVSSRKLVNRNRHAVRNFSIVFKKNFFTHYFGNHKLFRLVRYCIRIENVITFWKVFKYNVQKFFNVSSLSCRYGHYFIYAVYFSKFYKFLGDILFGHNIRFCKGNDHRYAYFRKFNG